jgi:glycosyltransferase involved in cell wall biosynthesis
MAAWARSEHPRLERFVGPLEVVHGTNFVVPPTRHAARVVSVWDLTFAKYPELCQPATLRFGHLVARAVRSGATVHTASAAIAEEVRAEFGARREQVCVVPLGIPELGEPDLETAASIIEPTIPYVLSVGTAEPRKDLPTLVAAFDAVAETHRDLELVLVGAPGWGEADLVAAIERARHPERIRRTGFVDDATVAGLLEGARTLAYPSRYEGFGFPPLQAMAAGVPVVTTRAGSLPEVVGGAALLVDPGEVEDLAEALEVAVFDEAQRTVLIAAGRARAGDFSWERTAEGLSALYRRVAGDR